ncbi:MAG TPA: FAD/NAD(P)-binding oxidoreductase [Acidiferrobacteraceae bacterium]|nr:FAD/NAD(P)-binding oxidoreductase [Acidiferrobacteraceae bacterium]
MRIVIVGGGMGGTIVANNLARRLKRDLRSGQAHITLLSASDRHMYQPGLLYVAVGRMLPDDLYRDQRSLLEPGITFEVDPVEQFATDRNQVTTRGGRTHEYDILIIATGSRIAPETIPGLNEHAEMFYTEEGAVRMFKRLNSFTGGRIVVTVGVPHKCPMAPLEITFLLHDFLKGRGLLDKTHIHYTYPIGRIHSLENVAKWATPEFERLGITYETLFNMKEVQPGVLKSEEGTEAPFDLLIAIPPHRGMPVIEQNKLGQNGWIPTNRHTLQLENGPKNVYVLGDTTNLPISKAGSTAHFEAEVVAENIVSGWKLGTPVRQYDGKVFCFIEASDSRATYAMFTYTQPPDPKAPTHAVHFFKTAYNRLYWASARGLL